MKPTCPENAVELARLVLLPAAMEAAAACEWLPGTGYCTRRDCSAVCLFRRWREAERDGIIRARSRRRAAHRPTIARHPRAG